MTDLFLKDNSIRLNIRFGFKNLPQQKQNPTHLEIRTYLIHGFTPKSNQLDLKKRNTVKWYFSWVFLLAYGNKI